MSQGEKRIGVF